MKSTTLFIILVTFFFNSSAQGFLLKEDFNDGIPNNWVNVAITGSDKWKSGLDGSNSGTGDVGVNNIDGTRMVIFDDDSIGSASLNNTVELKTSLFDNSNQSKSFLEFDYNFRSITDLIPTAFDSLYVEIYDGMGWHQIYSVSESNCGRYTTGFVKTNCELFGFPHVKIDISQYANKNCQISFRYHDGNDWAFYTALDNVWITYQDSIDIGVSEVISPASDCGLSDESVTVEIINYGFSSAHNFDIILDVNNGTQLITETVNDTIKPGDTLIYEFLATVNLNAVQEHQLTVYTIANQDNILLNDTAVKFVNNEVVKGIPYIESFENSEHGWNISGINPSWERGIPLGKVLDVASDSLRVFATNLIDANNNNERSNLTSPCIEKVDSIDQIKISFKLYRNIKNGDRLNFEYSTDKGLTWNNLNSTSISVNWYNSSFNLNWDGTSNGWQNVENIISGLNGVESFLIRFVFQSGSPNPNTPDLEGVMIDDLRVEIPSDTIDLGLTDILNLQNSNSLGLDYERPRVKIKNFGLNAVDSFDVSFTVDSSTTVKEKVVQTINSGSTYDYTFKDSIDFRESKIYSIDFNVSIPGDVDSINNTINNYLVDQLSNKPFNVPFRETFDQFPPTIEPIDFQNLPNQWLSIPFNNNYNSMAWKSGTTSDLQSNSEERGKIMFTTHANTTTNATASLISPFIFIDSSTTILSYWLYRFRANNFGTGDFYVDVFDGKDWQNSVDSVKGATAFAPPFPFEERRVGLGVDYLNKKIRIRFRSTSGIFATLPAFIAIDDVSVFIPQDSDIKITFLTDIQQSSCLYNSDIKIRLENIGESNIPKDSVRVFFQVNDGDIFNDTVHFSLPPKFDSIIVFSNQALFEPGINTLKIWSKNSTNVPTFDTIRIQINSNVTSNLLNEDFESYEVNNCNNLPINELKNGWTGNNLQLINNEYCKGSILGIPEKKSNSISNQHIRLKSSILISPCLSYTSIENPTLSFDYQINGNLFIDVFDNSGSWKNIDVISNNQFSQNEDWIHYSIPIGDSVSKIRLRNVGFTPTADIDNIQIYDRINDDAFLQDISSPSSACNLSSSEEVEIRIINHGNDTIQSNTLSAKLFLNNTLESTETISDIIPPDSSLAYSFTKTVDLSAFNTINSLNVELELSNDTNFIGNEFNLPKIASYTKIAGYIEDFETFERGYYEANSQNANQDGLDVIKEGWEVSPNSISNKYHWNVQKPLNEEKNAIYGGTVSSGTGPETDLTPNGETFIYTEASFGDFGDTANFTLACVDLSSLNTGSLQFWYHKFGADMGDLYVDFFSNGSWTNAVDSIMGETQSYHRDIWKKKVVSLNQIAGNEDVQIRFRAIRGNGERGDMAIDNIHLFDSLTVGVSELNISQEIPSKEVKLYPNPNGGLFNILVSDDLIGLDFYIIDLQGKILLSQSMLTNLNSIDLSNQPKGIYMLRIQSIGKTKKVIIY